LLSILIDDALAGHDPRTVCALNSAPPDSDPFAITPTQASGEFTSGDLASFLGIRMSSPANPIGGFQAGLASSVNSFSVYTVDVPVALSLNLPGAVLADVYAEAGGIPAGLDYGAFLLNSSQGGTTATALSGRQPKSHQAFAPGGRCVGEAEQLQRHPEGPTNFFGGKSL
jgi:hypothetical protein